MEAFAGITLLAVLIEGLVTYLFDKNDGVPRPWVRYVALGLGVVASIAYQVDIPALFGLVSPFPFVGYVFSGIIIGRGSNYVNDILGRIRS